MNKLILAAFIFGSSLSFGQTKKELDRKAITSMEGCFNVTFKFAETFSPNKDYEYHNDRKYSSALEIVKVIENTENKISLQHLLIVNDTFIIKHWRQDWLYENTNILQYVLRDENIEVFKNVQIPAEKAKGTWTQAVYQVDDSPRYQGYGTWVHVDGRSFWESHADAPLPRRERTKREDYNVTGRFSHIEIFEDGWLLDQDNDKILRKANEKDVLIAQEKGLERFWTGEYNCEPGEKYWTENEAYWEIVRAVWAEKLAKGTIEIKLSYNKDRLYMRLFDLCKKYNGEAKLNTKKVTKEVETIINEHAEVK